MLDREFYVMDRVEGSVPADRPPYTIAGFLHDASPEDQSRAYFGGLDVLVGLHGIDVRAAGLDFLGRPADGPTGFEQQLAHYARFLSLATGDVEHPTLHPGLDWLRANRPEGLDEGLSWGDSRLGNLMFRDFEPVAVFDWEMAALGPREVDLAWYVFFVRFFSDHLGLPNLPGFPPEEEGLAYYEDRTGHTARHLDYFLSWAAFRWGVIWTRLMPQRDPGELPDDWTIDDNPATRSVAELMGLPEPRG